MASQLYNNVTDYLAAGVGASDTTISVADGSKFTDPGQGNYTPLYLIRTSDGAHEIVHITAVSGNDLTVTRSEEGTDPLVFNSGDMVQIRPTRQSLLDMNGNVKTSTGEQNIGDALDRRVIYVDTIADLQALDAEVGQSVYLTQEGRAGEFVVKAGTPPSDPQQGIYIVLANGNYAERQYSGELVAEWFGPSVTDAIAAAIDFLPDEGGVIDATSFIGTQTFTSDIFASRTKPFTLVFGPATFELDLANFSLKFNSDQHFVLKGTKFRPDVANPGAAGGLFESNQTTTQGSITAGSRILSVASLDRIKVGGLLAIEGAQGADDNEQKSLSSGIDSTQTSIPVSGDTATIPSTYVFVIGNEIITGTEKDASNLLNVTRGAFGTTAASHLSGELVSFSPNLRAVVTDISGMSVTLDRPAVASVTDAAVTVGTVGASFTGYGEIDGRIDREGGNQTNSFGIALKMAKDCHIGERIALNNWEHGGLYIESGFYNTFRGAVSGNARPNLKLGASIWVFRGSVGNTIAPCKIEDGNIGVFIDDRTSNANLLDGPCDENIVYLPKVESHVRALEISGSRNNTAYINSTDTSSTSITVATNEQGENPRVVSGNTVKAGYVNGAVVQRGQNNVCVIGSSGGIIDNGSNCICEVLSGDSRGYYYGRKESGGRYSYKGSLDTGITLESGSTTVTTDDVLGALEFVGSDDSGGGPGIKAAIRAVVDDSLGRGGRLSFHTAASGANDVECMRLDRLGQLVLLSPGMGIVLKSPNGTDYTVTVDDSGNIVTS